jgi:hypothetical protein
MKNVPFLAAFVSSASCLMAVPAHAGASAAMSLSSRATAAVMEQVQRREEDQDQDQDQNNEMSGQLVDYSAKIVKCIPHKVIKDENGDKSFGVVLFRMCPADQCTGGQNMGCSDDYADFAVALKTYVYAYLQDQVQEMNWDDVNFGQEDFAQCSQYFAEDGSEYYVGPACTSDGSGVKFGLFHDSNCTSAASDSNVKLPFSGSGLVDTNCVECAEDGNIKDMCSNLYDAAQYRCETQWSFSHYYYDAVTEIYRYGQDEVGCKFINGYEKRPKRRTEWGEVFFIFLLVVMSVSGFVMYNRWWKESKYKVAPNPCHGRHFERGA